GLSDPALAEQQYRIGSACHIYLAPNMKRGSVWSFLAFGNSTFERRTFNIQSNSSTMPAPRPGLSGLDTTVTENSVASGIWSNTARRTAALISVEISTSDFVQTKATGRSLRSEKILRASNCSAPLADPMAGPE